MSRRRRCSRPAFTLSPNRWATHTHSLSPHAHVWTGHAGPGATLIPAADPSAATAQPRLSGQPMRPTTIHVVAAAVVGCMAAAGLFHVTAAARQPVIADNVDWPVYRGDPKGNQ